MTENFDNLNAKMSGIVKLSADGKELVQGHNSVGQQSLIRIARKLSGGSQTTSGISKLYFRGSDYTAGTSVPVSYSVAGNVITFSASKTASTDFTFYYMTLSDDNGNVSYTEYGTSSTAITIPANWELRVAWTITCNIDSSYRGMHFYEVMKALTNASYTASNAKIGVMTLRYTGSNYTTSSVSVSDTEISTTQWKVTATSSFDVAASYSGIYEIALSSADRTCEYLKYPCNFSKASGDGLEVTLTYTLTV